jgi:hypothetical protein
MNLPITGFPPGWMATLFHGVVGAVGGVDVRGQGLSELGDARVGAIAGLARQHVLVGRGDDVVRGADVHVAQMKRVDLVALGREGRCPGADRKGGFGAEP